MEEIMDREGTELAAKRCAPCEGGTPPLGKEEIGLYLAGLEGWKAGDGEIVKRFEFRNYHETISFVNAVAWIAHRENHHPDLQVSYRRCRVRYSTHAVGGLSENDFICAAKVDSLFL
jgi:4a-hydroxytetrahydrobiopterin dehydratase